MNKKRLIALLVPLVFTGGTIILNFYCPMKLIHYKTDMARLGDIRILGSALDLFRAEQKRFPATDEGLEALVSKPSESLTNWRPYLDRLPTDPWSNEYIYKLEERNSVEFMLYSKGPDGIDNDGGHDDVVNWDKDYNCELNYRCPTVCERSRDGMMLVALFSWIALAGLSLYSGIQSLIRRHRAPV